MSEYAPFADAATSIDATDRSRTFISYYTYGAAIALGARSVAARDVGRQAVARRLHAPAVAALRQAGRAGAGPRRQAVLAEGSARRARRADGQPHVRRRLLRQVRRRPRGRRTTRRCSRGAGYVLRPRAPGRGWIGNVAASPRCRTDFAWAVVAAAVATRRASPVAVRHAALRRRRRRGRRDHDDRRPAARRSRPWRAIAQRKPGDNVTLVVRRRDGKLVTTTAKLVADPARAGRGDREAPAAR